MHTMISQFAAPALATAIVGVVMAFPTPSDLRNTLWPEAPRLDILSTGVPDAETSRVDPTGGDAVANVLAHGCFKDLGTADKARLEACAEVVVEALAEISRYQQQIKGVKATPADPDPVPILEELRLAATQVCRAKWSSGEPAFLGSPACGVTELTLVTE